MVFTGNTRIAKYCTCRKLKFKIAATDLSGKMNIKEFIYMNERIYTIGHIRESNASIQHHQKRAQTFRFKFSTKKKNFSN